MTAYLLAGGGTAGHVNPLLAVADLLRETEPDARLVLLGTAEGLESRLVPARGYELTTIPKLPFPRRPNLAALRFPRAFRASVRRVERIIRDEGVEAVIGFGGYASAPAYLAAGRAGVPLVLHEANARPGLANRLGARRAARVGVAFAGTPLRGARVVGMPLRREIAELDRAATRDEAARHFGLDAGRPVLLVTGGSLGARRINATLAARATQIVATGWQVLHIQGERGELSDPRIPGYRLLDYCDRMDLALALADAAVARAGAATVSEFATLGIPAVYVPFPIGNGEQRVNAAGLVAAGGGMLVDDAAFSPAWLDDTLLPLLADRGRLTEMAERAGAHGGRDGAARLVRLIHEAVEASGPRADGEDRKDAQ